MVEWPLYTKYGSSFMQFRQSIQRVLAQAVFCTALGLGGLVFQPSPSEAQSSVSDINPTMDLQVGQCAACHVKGEHIQQLGSMEKCEQCHGKADHEPRLQKVSQTLADALTQGKTSGNSSQGKKTVKTENDSKRTKALLAEPGQETDKSIVHKILPTAGMSYPIYYQGSRIGSEPNKMVLVPAGEFIMGTDDRLPDEGPQHKVYLPAYYIDIYEVTNLQYKQFNDATHRRSPTHFRNRTFPEGKADHPVTYVSWEDADAYCRWAKKRLPTDQEWEKAARGTDGRMFPWGGEFDVKKANTPIRWQQIGSFGDTTPVGAFENGKSPYGLYDTTGNVWEWTASWYQAYPNNKVASESYGTRYKTLKGGSWFDCSFYKCGISAPVFNRAFFATRTKNDSFGFRCAGDVATNSSPAKPTSIKP